jgi:hypothetical protein
MVTCVYRKVYNHGLPRWTSSVPFFAPSFTLIHLPRRGSRPTAATSRMSAGTFARFGCRVFPAFSSGILPFSVSIPSATIPNFCQSSVLSLPFGTARSCRLLTTPAAGIEQTNENCFRVGDNAHNLISPSQEPEFQCKDERLWHCTSNVRVPHLKRIGWSPSVRPMRLSILAQPWRLLFLNHAEPCHVRDAL